jgi:hypothetical protein
MACRTGASPNAPTSDGRPLPAIPRPMRIVADSGAVRRVVFSTTEPEFRWMDVIAIDSAIPEVPFGIGYGAWTCPYEDARSDATEEAADSDTSPSRGRTSQAHSNSGQVRRWISTNAVARSIASFLEAALISA